MHRYFALLVALVAVAGCRRLTSDSATRIEFGLREGASRMSPAPGGVDSVTVRVAARTWPRGCPAAYRVELLADSTADTAQAKGIRVTCLPKGRVYTSTRAMDLVRTPATLTLDRGAGQPVDITLKRVGRQIEVLGLE